MNFFKDLDDGFYFAIFVIAVLAFVFGIISLPSKDVLMAREGYIQKVEIVNVQQVEKVWVKENTEKEK